MITALPKSILTNIGKETRYIEHTGNKARSVKLNKGDSWLLRFIPKLMGPADDQTFFARVAKHWMYRKPITCPRHTSPAFGGDPEAYCPICEVADKLMDSPNKAEADFAFSCRASSQWLVWCIVLEKGKGVAEPLPEVLNPYEFWMYKSNYEEFIGYFKNNLRRSEMSIFDYKTGNDFVFTKNAKTSRLDKQDSGPIFDLDDPKFEDKINKIEAACKDPKPPKATEKALNEFADKLEENANKVRSGRGGSGDEEEDGGRGRGRGRDDDDRGGRTRGRAEPADADEEAEAPRSRRAAPAEDEEPAEPAQPRRTARAAAPEEEEDAAPPQPRRRAAEVEAEAEAPRSRRAPAEPDEEAAAEPDAEAEEDAGLAPVRGARTAAPPASRRTPPPAAARRAEPEDEESQEPPAPRRSAATAPPQRRAAAPAADEEEAEQPVARRAAAPAGRAAGGRAAEPLDEEEALPEEATDAAPPANAADEEDEAVEPPRRTTAAKPAARPAGSAAPSTRLTQRIQSASK